MNLSPRKKLFVDTAAEMFGIGATLTKANTLEAAKKAGVPSPTWFRRTCKVGYNAFKLPGGEPVAAPSATTVDEEGATVNLVATNMDKQNLIPAPFEGFVPWGNFKKLEKVV